jgi:putative membrane protein
MQTNSLNAEHESKYIQQHLANERTFLAWVRTSIAIVGIGFLAASLHFNTQGKISYVGDLIAISVSSVSLVVGFVTIITASLNYFRIRKSINTQTYTSSYKFVIYTVIIVTLIFVLIFAYVYIG